jgi:hypothetical protein
MVNGGMDNGAAGRQASAEKTPDPFSSLRCFLGVLGQNVIDQRLIANVPFLCFLP